MTDETILLHKIEANENLESGIPPGSYVSVSKTLQMTKGLP